MPPPPMGDSDVFRPEDNASQNGNGKSPVLLEAVNKNGLVLFLVVSSFLSSYCEFYITKPV